MYNSMPRDLVEVNQAKAVVVASSYLGSLLLLWTRTFRARSHGLRSARTSWRSSSSMPAFLGCQRSCYVLVIQYYTCNLCFLTPSVFNLDSGISFWSWTWPFPVRRYPKVRRYENPYNGKYTKRFFSSQLHFLLQWDFAFAFDLLALLFRVTRCLAKMAQLVRRCAKTQYWHYWLGLLLWYWRLSWNKLILLLPGKLMWKCKSLLNYWPGKHWRVYGPRNQAAWHAWYCQWRG